MKMKILFVVLASLLTTNLVQAYDNTWFEAQGWPGEYPPGFRVYKKGIKVLGRTSMDNTEAPSVECTLKRNRYAPSLALPKAQYFQMSKIVEMTAKADFNYDIHTYNVTTEQFDESTLTFKAGDKIEYLHYMAEGWFLARYNGVEFEADQSLFESVNYDESKDFETDLWINLSCVNNVNVWLMYSDLYISEENDTWIDGVEHYFHNPY